MEIEKTRDLRSWIDKGTVSDDEKESIELLLKAFSDYVTAVNSEYEYNKSFLKDFIPAFILSNKMLNIKKEFLDKLIDSLQDYKENLRIEIDNAWIYNGIKDDKIVLSNVFSKSKVNSEKLCYQIKYSGKKSFVIAKNITVEQVENGMNKVIGEIEDLFLNRLGEDNEN